MAVRGRYHGGGRERRTACRHATRQCFRPQSTAEIIKARTIKASTAVERQAWRARASVTVEMPVRVLPKPMQVTQTSRQAVFRRIAQTPTHEWPRYETTPLYDQASLGGLEADVRTVVGVWFAHAAHESVDEFGREFTASMWFHTAAEVSNACTTLLISPVIISTTSTDSANQYFHTDNFDQADAQKIIDTVTDNSGSTQNTLTV